MALKPFLPQLQTTFVKCLQDSTRLAWNNLNWNSFCASMSLGSSMWFRTIIAFLICGLKYIYVFVVKHTQLLFKRNITFNGLLSSIYFCSNHVRMSLLALLANFDALFLDCLIHSVWVQDRSFKRCPCTWKAQCTQYQGWPFSWGPCVQFAGEDWQSILSGCMLKSKQDYVTCLDFYF